MTNLNRFQVNDQNEHISMKSLIPMDFQKRAFYRLLYLSEILPKCTDFKDFQEIACTLLLVQNTNFSNQMLYRSVLLHENFQCFGLSAVQALVLISRKLGKYAILLIGVSFVWSIWSKNSPVETI